MAVNKRVEVEVAVATTGDKELDRLLQTMRNAGQDVAPFEKAAQALGAELQKLRQQQGLIDNFVRLKRASGQAATELQAAQQRAQDLGKALAQTAEPTKKQTAEFERARKAVGAAKQAYEDATRALDQTRGAMAEAGVQTKGLSAQQTAMAKGVQAAQQALRENAEAARAAATGQQELTAKTQAQAAASAAAAKATEANTASVKNLDAGATDLAAKLGTLQTILGTVFGVQLGTQLLSDLAATADAYNNLSARIKISTGEGAGFEAAMAGVQRVAVETRSSLEETANLYTRISEAGKTLKLSQDQVLGLVQTINQAIQVSGGSADSAQAAIAQLNQALQSGVLRGEEFNSIMEQSPRVAKALADGLGVGIGKLREMAEAGRLSSEVVIAALRGQSDAVAAEFAKLPPTVGGALQNLSTAWTVYVGDVDKASGASRMAADAINALSRNLEEVAGYLAGAGQAAASLYALNLAQRFLGIGQAAAASAGQIASNTAATVANAAATADNAAAQAAHAAASTQDAAATTADTVATTANTVATTANTAASTAAATATSKNAESWKTLGTELGNTSAKAGAAAGAMSAGAAETGKLGAAAVDAAAKKGILSAAIGAVGGAARGFMALLGGPLGLIALTAMFAEDIGKLAGRFSLWVTGQKTLEQSTKELEAAQKKEAEAARAVAEAREKQTAADKAAADAKFGLNERGKELIAQFDDLIKKGDSAADAIGKIGKDFDLSTQPGIQTAASVLDKLAADAKITADQFQTAWSQALQGVDLAKFEIDFKAMLLQLEVEAEKAGKAVEQAIARGASKEVIDALRLKAEQAAQAVQAAGQRMATVFDVTLGEAIRRTGLDMDLIAKGMGKASVSAINDVDTIIRGLDKLKEQGVDTGRVLSTSLSKAIDTADGQKSIDLLKQKIEQVRSVLGDKVADGLLDQAADKARKLKEALDDATPGINSVAEAMKTLGITSDESLRETAKTAKEAYDTLASSGTASAREVGEGFKKAAEAAIEANRGVAPEWVKSAASMRGFAVEVDAAGKATLRLKDATDAAAGAHSNAARAAAEEISALDQLNKAKEREVAILEKANELKEREQELYRKKWQMDKEGYSVDADGKRIEQVNETQQSIYNKGKDAGLTAKQAQELADRFAPRGKDQFFRNDEYWKEVNRLKQLSDLAEEEQKNRPAAPALSPAPAAPAPSPAPIRAPAPAQAPRQPQQSSGGGGSASITPAPTTQAGGTNISHVHIRLENKNYGVVDTNASGANVLQNVLRDLAAAKRVAQ